MGRLGVRSVCITPGVSAMYGAGLWVAAIAIRAPVPAVALVAIVRVLGPLFAGCDLPVATGRGDGEKNRWECSGDYQAAQEP